jgi:nitrite reductase/ring-hydroxylating ferredoxin subunit/uncharacterized membrane protein
MLKDFLQGKPFAHPLHPALVHFPIGAFLLSFLFDLAIYLFGAQAAPLSYGAYNLIIVGFVMALLAAIPGLVDWLDIRADHPAKRTATTHMLLNLAAVGLFGINLLLRSGDPGQAPAPLLPFLLSFAGLAVIFYSGYLGGTLVYADGIAVGRHRRRTPTPERTLIETSGQAQAGFIPVAAAGSLQPGETLRVEVDGHVLAVVNLDGAFYAFQEFCTHRFGPLSEGSFNNHQVECPWHRSQFDVRTGKVVKGPAKVGLKTFEVTVRDGQIMVRTPQVEPSSESEEQRVEANRMAAE